MRRRWLTKSLGVSGPRLNTTASGTYTHSHPLLSTSACRQASSTEVSGNWRAASALSATISPSFGM